MIDLRDMRKKQTCEEFGKRLSKSMETQGISQTAVAKILNTTQQTVSRWCKGKCEPRLDDIILLSGILGENPNDLLGFDDKDAWQYYKNAVEVSVELSKEFSKENKLLLDELIKKGYTNDEITVKIADLKDKKLKEFIAKENLSWE